MKLFAFSVYSYEYGNVIALNSQSFKVLRQREAYNAYHSIFYLSSNSFITLIKNFKHYLYKFIYKASVYFIN